MSARLTRPLAILKQASASTRQTPNPRIITTPTPFRRTFQTGPSPPRLPPDQQAEFERLQRTANTQQGFNATSTPEPPASASSDATATSTPLRKGAPPEFEGDVNPRTGEVGGPKNEPLRWGAAGDYSFNGRVTDF